MSSHTKTISHERFDQPFFEPKHRELAEAIDRFVTSGAIDGVDHGDVDGACRKLVRALGSAGLLDCAVATPDPHRPGSAPSTAPPTKSDCSRKRARLCIP